MSTFKQAISLIVFGIMMFTSLSSQANACAENEQNIGVSAQIVQVLADSQQVLEVVSHEHSSENSTQKQHSGHCHCVSQGCCGFLVIPFVSSLDINSQEKRSPLVSVSLFSWVSVPPTRPPSA
jgi:hypothetical protein